MPQQVSEVDNAADSTQQEMLLWRRWTQKPEPLVQQQLVEFYLPWVHLIAREVKAKLYTPNAEWADYLHYGTLGLLQALSRYQPDYGVQFKTYARERVRGAILNGISTFMPIAKHHEEFDQIALEERVDSYTAERSDDPLGHIISVTINLAISHLLDGQPDFASPADAPKQIYRSTEEVDIHDAIRHILEDMPITEREIIELHYFQQYKFLEIADIMGLSKGRISQLHRRGIERIRAYFDELREQNILL